MDLGTGLLCVFFSRGAGVVSEGVFLVSILPAIFYWEHFPGDVDLIFYEEHVDLES